MNEKLEYVLETIRFKTSIYRDKKKRNLTFNDDDYYSNILNEYITNLQQENARLKDKIEKAIMYIENTYDDVVSSFTEDKPMTNFKARKELLEILKEN